MFAGRVDELKFLEKVLLQTANENPMHFVLVGERGIGKSSLMYYLQNVAKGLITTFEDQKYNFLVINIELEPTSTYVDIVKKVGAELHREVLKNDSLKEMMKTGWDFLKCWKVMGVEYGEDKKDLQPHELLEDLSNTFERTLSSLSTNIDGILVLIDEADKPSVGSNLGEFVKIFTERLTKRGCNKVSLGLAGLPELIQKLSDSHESSPRIFETISLGPLEVPERIYVIERGLESAKEINGFDVTITPDAESLISSYSEGFPQFLQQYSFSAFDQDSDNNITDEDVANGAVKDNGALQQLGQKYFNKLYFDQIKSDEYREILKAMSRRFDGWVKISELRKELKIRSTIFNNAIAALKKRNIIIPAKGKKGEYKLPNRSFAIWIKVLFDTEVKSTSSESKPANI